MKVACVVILYYPNQEVYTNILTYYHKVDKLYVFDNSEQPTSFGQQLRDLVKIDFYHDGQNEGIAKRLNTAASKALEDGYEWLLMMDQDSSFQEDVINNYFNCMQQQQPKNNIALFGVNYDQDTEIISHPCDPVFADDLITSGSLLNLSLFTSIGPFDENLFIDAVDNEYSIRTLICGYRIVKFKNIYLKHSIGVRLKRSSIKTLYLVKKEKILHSPLRLYYIYRNNLYLQQKYENQQTEVLQKLDKIVGFAIWRNLHYGRNLLKMVYYLYRARKDFKKNRMGKFIRSQ
jgi:rhamnosyltransferase